MSTHLLHYIIIALRYFVTITTINGHRYAIEDNKTRLFALTVKGALSHVTSLWRTWHWSLFLVYTNSRFDRENKNDSTTHICVICILPLHPTNTDNRSHNRRQKDDARSIKSRSLHFSSATGVPPPRPTTRTYLPKFLRARQKVQCHKSISLILAVKNSNLEKE